MIRFVDRLLVAAAVLSLVLIVAGCASTTPDDADEGRPSVPTPLPSLTATLSVTAGLLRGALADAGFGLEQTTRPVRPSEPASLVMAPRAALQTSLADPDEGFVIVYDLSDPAEAQARAEDLAAYLESGFGQTNFTADTRFSVAVLDDTVAFAWWIPSHSSDIEAGQAAFDAISTVGVPIEVAR